MAKSSAHFSSTGGDDSHNKRDTMPDYVRSIIERDLQLEKNLSSTLQRTRINGQYFKTFSEVKSYIEDDYKANSYRGRKIQKHTNIFREAVVNLNPDTSLDQIKNLTTMLNKEFGITTLSAHIHEDEGYINRYGKFVQNRHLQIQTTWYQFGQGKFWRPKQKDLSELQTRIAEVLDMERGLTWEERKELGISKATRLSQYLYRFKMRIKKLESFYEESGSVLSDEDRTAYLNGGLQDDDVCKILRIYESENTRQVHSLDDEENVKNSVMPMLAWDQKLSEEELKILEYITKHEKLGMAYDEIIEKYKKDHYNELEITQNEPESSKRTSTILDGQNNLKIDSSQNKNKKKPRSR